MRIWSRDPLPNYVVPTLYGHKDACVNIFWTENSAETLIPRTPSTSTTHHPPDPDSDHPDHHDNDHDHHRRRRRRRRRRRLSDGEEEEDEEDDEKEKKDVGRTSRRRSIDRDSSPTPTQWGDKDAS